MAALWSRLIVVVGVALASLVSPVALASGQDMATRLPIVVKESQKTKFGVGEVLLIRIRREWNIAGLRARIFRGVRSQLIAKPVGTRDGCWLYDSLVLTPMDNTDDELRFGYLDETWLAVDSGGLRTGAFVLVLEIGEPVDETVKIRPTRVSEYFKNAWQFSVERAPRTTNAAAAVVESNLQERAAKTAAAAGTVPCIEQVREPDAGIVMVSVAPCIPPAEHDG